MGLRDIGESLPPGFRFYPSDDELICHYLYKKVTNEEVVRGTLVDVDLHVCEPWQLPDLAKLNSNEWYFFSFRDRKYATGFRANRATATGYWKATGKDRVVLDPTTRAVVGMRKTLVFYKNRAPNGIKTGWIMHEFRLENPDVPPREDWVLCRVFHKSRSENSNKIMMSPYNLYDHSTCTNNEHAMPSCGHQNIIMTSFYHSPTHHHHHHHEAPNPRTSLEAGPVQASHDLDMIETRHPHPHHQMPTLSNYNYQNKATISNDQATNKCEDDFGFLFDLDGSNNMGFDDENCPAVFTIN